MNQLISFLNEYATFLEEAAAQESEKHTALLSYDPKRMDKAIAMQQATQMRLSRMEEQREQEQRRVGMENVPFREMLARTDGGEHDELEKLFNRIEHAIWDIKYLNSKSLAFARAGMKTLGDYERITQGAAYTGGGKKTAEGASSLFDANI